MTGHLTPHETYLMYMFGVLFIVVVGTLLWGMRNAKN